MASFTKADPGQGLNQPIPTQEAIQLELARLEKSIQQATNTTQLLKLLNQIDSKNHQIDNVLHQFISRQSVEHRSAVRSLEISRVELSNTLNHSRSLKKITEDASQLSSKITEKVRLLDAERSQIQTTKDYVENVKVLKTEVHKAHDAIEHQDWLSASRSISIIKRLPEGLISDEFVQFIVPTSDLDEMPETLLKSWIEELNTIFIKEFNLAAESKDTQRLTYFFQLFPLIGKSEDGLNCYSKFICGIISKQSRSILMNVQDIMEVK
ncbi:unnamed protein product [Ambrosiozyma monospora]|uniref:Unnamed protein product n=1 Tax=Ambrosiozyma monospora TaxID=43982 RepID=A0ACB5TGS5_AMBMO|nr:unnamed protein product [Ambrosiozyma monospora]